jgi:hypothetical protein
MEFYVIALGRLLSLLSFVLTSVHMPALHVTEGDPYATSQQLIILKVSPLALCWVNIIIDYNVMPPY